LWGYACHFGVGFGVLGSSGIWDLLVWVLCAWHLACNAFTRSARHDATIVFWQLFRDASERHGRPPIRLSGTQNRRNFIEGGKCTEYSPMICGIDPCHSACVDPSSRMPNPGKTRRVRSSHDGSSSTARQVTNGRPLPAWESDGIDGVPSGPARTTHETVRVRAMVVSLVRLRSKVPKRYSRYSVDGSWSTTKYLAVPAGCVVRFSIPAIQKADISPFCLLPRLARVVDPVVCWCPSESPLGAVVDLPRRAWRGD
jgi:hypothetical protein